MNNCILCVNAGSSSIKFDLYEQSSLKSILKGSCVNIGTTNGMIMYVLNGEKKICNVSLPTFDIAIKEFLKTLKDNLSSDIKITTIGHRIVHGSIFDKHAEIITPKIHQVIKDYIDVAPLHNGPELKIVDILMKILPKTKHVAIFDTAFHTTIPRINSTYAIDQTLAKRYKIKKYGFHGISYSYINKLFTTTFKKPKHNIIVCHLGAGSSVCAIKDSKSFDTSMGFSPLDGIVMGSRCGSIDPAIVTFLNRKKFNQKKMDDVLYHKSG
jgi:acetate kinase